MCARKRSGAVASFIIHARGARNKLPGKARYLSTRTRAIFALPPLSPRAALLYASELGDSPGHPRSFFLLPSLYLSRASGEPRARDVTQLARSRPSGSLRMYGLYRQREKHIYICMYIYATPARTCIYVYIYRGKESIGRGG